MPPFKFTYTIAPDAPSSVLREDGVESGFIVSNRDNTYAATHNSALHFAEPALALAA